MSARCLVCENTTWVNVDKHRIKPHGMAMCSSCSFITYPERITNKKNLKDYYEEDYRRPPTINNLYTGQRKLNYHAAFLDELFNQWDSEYKTPAERGEGKDVFEVGAAYGIVLHWVKRQFPKANVMGTEWTKSFKRNAWHEFGINLIDNFDDSKKYDLIMSYKVAEHMIDADKELRKYALSLKENGKLYISVPQWFGELNNFGMSGFDIEYYYHPDHINVWTRGHFEYILKKAGLEVTKVNHTYYDSTYLCVRNDSLMDSEVFKEDTAFIESQLKAVMDTSKCMDKNDFVGAIEAYPNFPLAHINRYELNRKRFHDMGFEKIEKEVIQFGFKCCPESAEVMGMAADIYMRYDKWNEALKCLDKALAMKPALEKFMISAANVLFKMSQKEQDGKEKIKLLLEAKNILSQCKNTSMQAVPQCTDMIYQINSILPTKEEITANQVC